MKKLMVFLLASLPMMAFANSNCDKPVNDFDGLYCLSKVYFEADKDLNESYKELVSLLDSTGKATLKQSQLAWMKQRNSGCSRRDGEEFLVNMDCATNKTISRPYRVVNAFIHRKSGKHGRRMA